jgi:hypothetical protein
MSILDQLPVSTTAFTLATLLALWVVSLIYSHNRSQAVPVATKKVSSKAGNSRMLDDRHLK